MSILSYITQISLYHPVHIFLNPIPFDFSIRFQSVPGQYMGQPGLGLFALRVFVEWFRNQLVHICVADSAFQATALLRNSSALPLAYSDGSLHIVTLTSSQAHLGLHNPLAH